MNIKKLTLGLLVSVFSFILVFSFFAKFANAGTSELTGWGWSPNIGWISLNCSNTNSCATSNYKVQIATTTSTDGIFSGYAWSSNIGWIKFAGDKDHEGPVIDLDKGSVTGWIRACAGTVNKDCASVDRTDGWDGWMKLSEPGTIYPTRKIDGSGGLTYDPATGQFVGYAWGGLLGWITFSPNVPPPSNTKCPGCIGDPGPNNPTATCLINPAVITIPSAGATRVITPSVGSYMGGVGPYTFSPTTFTVGQGVGQIMSVVVTDSSKPTAKTGVVSCNPITVQVGTVGSGLNMWVPPATGADTKSNSSIKIKPGQSATVKWDYPAGSTLTSCRAYIDGVQLTGTDSITCNTQQTLIRTELIPKGVYKYSMLGTDATIGSPTNGQVLNALAPNGGYELIINVSNSNIKEQ